MLLSFLTPIFGTRVYISVIQIKKTMRPTLLGQGIQNSGNLKSGGFRISGEPIYETVETENDFKAAVCSIVSRSPLFALCSTKYQRLQILVAPTK